MQSFSSRKFQLWEYKVSHQQLLLRSPKSNQHLTNIDVAFAGVNYISIPAFLGTFTFVEPNETEIEFSYKFKKGNYSPQVFVLEAQGNRHLIIAARMKYFENNLEMFESSLESFQVTE